jgi:hypothetical protein
MLSLVNKKSVTLAASVGLLTSAFAPSAQALTLDWAGYFRADHNLVNGIQGESAKTANFSSMFMKLKPRVLVNDNVIVHSEWDVGDQVAGFFGRGIPRYDRNNALSTDKAGFDITARRLWLDVHTDFGTVQVGRAPFSWGLGAVFNAGDGPHDRFQSTMDTVRVVSKFGYLSLMPIFAKNAMGRSLGGARNPLSAGPNFDQVLSGSDDVTDYGIALKYDNPEEELEGGVMYYKRSAGDSQNSYFYPATNGAAGPGNSFAVSRANGMDAKLINAYAKKTFRRFSVGVEVPLYSGQIGDINAVGSRNNLSATALAFEAALKYDTWKHSLKAGSAPGQEAQTTGSRSNSFGGMSFHRAYKLGLIMFNYNLARFGAANPDSVPGDNQTGNNLNATDRTINPYDAAITNARYVMLSTEKHWEQWGLNAGAIWASANHSAQAGKDFYNPQTNSYYASGVDQGKSLGIELDIGGRYNWDDNISFGLDAGILFPGSYLKTLGSTNGSDTLSKNVAAISISAATVF